MRLLLIFSFLWIGSAASACFSPPPGSNHAPQCNISIPMAGERVVVLHNTPEDRLADLHLGHPERFTRVTDVTLEANGEPLFLVLSAAEQTIWRFSGDTHLVSRAVVLGSMNPGGAAAAGVIGLERDFVEFTDPDLRPMLAIPWSTCIRRSASCVPEQWFGPRDANSPTIIPRYDGPRFLEVEVEDSWTVLHRIFDAELPTEWVEIDPETVVAPGTVAHYDIFPGQRGLDQLVEEGVLLPVDMDDPPATVTDWGERFSARFHDRRPEFSVLPFVHYIVMEETPLPGRLPAVALMMAPGVPAPKNLRDAGYAFCIYVQELADRPYTRGDGRNRACQSGGSLRDTFPEALIEAFEYAVQIDLQQH